MCYAESKDGLRFRKPILGLVEKDGSRENNLVMPTDLSVMTVGGGSVARDDNPAAPAEKRYRSWSKLYTVPGTRKGGNAFWYSEDGLRWHLEETLPTGLRAADTQPSWFWDPAIGRYRGYSREVHPRMVGYNESDDMTHWENFEIVLLPDARDLAPLVDFLPRRQQSRASETAHQVETVFGPGYTVVGPLSLDFYGTGVFRYAEAQDAYFAMIPIYYHYRPMHPTTADVQLAASRDGRNFLRLGERQSFLRLGHAGSFGSKWVWGMPRPYPHGQRDLDLLRGDQLGPRRPRRPRSRRAPVRRLPSRPPARWVRFCRRRLPGRLAGDASHPVCRQQAGVEPGYERRRRSAGGDPGPSGPAHTRVRIGGRRSQ